MTHAEKFKRDAEIIKLRKQGYSMSELADMFDLASVHHICKRYGVAGVMSKRKATHNPNQHNQYYKKTEEDKKKYVESFLDPGFSYVDGYIDSDHKVRIECKKCGAVFERSMVSIRKSASVICPNCNRIRKENKRIEKMQKQKDRAKQREARKSAIEEAKAKRIRHIVCEVCGKQFTTNRTNQKYCSKECAKKAFNKYSSGRKDKRFKDRGMKQNRSITAKSLYERDGGVCWICGERCDIDDYEVKDGVVICGNNYPSVDHVIPVCEGGSDTWDNVKLAHRICNTKRYHKTAPASCVVS